MNFSDQKEKKPLFLKIPLVFMKFFIKMFIILIGDSGSYKAGVTAIILCCLVSNPTHVTLWYLITKT